jgi:hypothetical protein
VGLARFPIVSEKDQAGDFGFEVLTGGPSIRFGQLLSNAVVDLESDVELGYAGRPMVLGPDVYLSCRSLSMSAAAYRLHTTVGMENQPAGVILIADNVKQGSVPELKVFGDQFRIQANDLTYPWAPYRTAPAADTTDANWDQFSKLRKIMVHFRAHGRGELARYRPFVDNVLVGKSVVAKALMRTLLDKGVIRQDGDFYFLSRERIDALGISQNDLVESRMSSGIASLLAEVPKN